MNIHDILSQGKKLRDKFNEEYEKENPDVESLNVLILNVVTIMGECNKLLEIPHAIWKKLPH
ncbi:MAG: hypothetical protein LIP01_08785, partial [Tannerellaceae bacterium]|nr:hypothetical protein [Tannerellaceae bacterium]